MYNSKMLVLIKFDWASIFSLVLCQLLLVISYLLVPSRLVARHFLHTKHQANS